MLRVLAERLGTPGASFIAGAIAAFVALVAGLSITLPPQPPAASTLYIWAAAGPEPATKAASELAAPPPAPAAAPLPRPRPHAVERRPHLKRTKPQAEPRQAQIRQGLFCFLLCMDQR
jgi:hypothetical protein